MNSVKYVNNKEIDRVKWDSCIQNSFNKKVYAYSWYLDVVTYNWDALIYNDYEVVFPIIFKNRFFYTKIYHPLFCQQLGPFGSKINLFKNDSLLEIILFLNHKYRKFIFSINHLCVPVCTSIIHDNKLRINCVNRINLELNLSSSYQNIYSNYSKNIKRKLHKNVKRDWVLQDLLIQEFITFYKKNTYLKFNLNDRSYQTMKVLMKESLSRKSGRLLGMRSSNNNLFAAAFFLYSDNTDTLLFNASDNSIQHNGMTLLIDKYIKMNSCKNHILDFEGSNILGVQRFYKGFGAKEKNYMHIMK